MQLTVRRRLTRVLAFVHDVGMSAVSLPVSLWLRMEGLGRATFDIADYALATAMYGGLAAVVFLVSPSRAMWRYVSPVDLVRLARNVTALEFLFLAASVMTGVPALMPRSVFFIQWLVLLALLAGSRLAWRLLQEGHLGPSAGVDDRVPTLLAGSGDHAEHFVRAVRRDRQFGLEIVGLLEADASRLDLEIHGVPIVGTLDAELAKVVEVLEARGRRPRKLLIAGGRVAGPLTRQLVSEAEQLGLSIARIADSTEVRAGQGGGLHVQPIQVEDLLNRPQTALSPARVVDLVSGRRVLVTGAGGSIGSELVRQVCAFGPERVVLAELSEHNLYQIDHEVAERWPNAVRVPVLCDVRDAAHVARLMEEHRPDLVLHAAALKHVPMVEHNPCQGVLTNVLGSRVVADACVAHGVSTMVLISTDKAVRPTNVMGATKRLAERYCQALDLEQVRAAGRGTRFVTVRFGNVLGSSGSVVPLFQRQLEAGGPITVTHPDIERYFMTIREAVQLVLHAGALPPAADEAGKLYVLDMGEPVKIVDLARQMIRLAGLTPGEDVEIAFVGLRPGEKLYEELAYEDEDLVPTDVPSLCRASPAAAVLAELVPGVEALVRFAQLGDVAGTRRQLQVLVPEFGPGRRGTAAAVADLDAARARRAAQSQGR
ncbi:MAG: polysaccharide biosynthesis protein [Alphaproteobacteria bacterium]|nr:polysaccharide biosynthesis protein [Alphaproteobacteria bacterium]